MATYLKYYLRGFELLNRNLYIFFWSSTLLILNYLTNQLFGALGIVVSYLSFSFAFVIPILFSKALDAKGTHPLSTQSLLRTTAIKLLPTYLLFSIIFLGLATLIVLFIVITTGINLGALLKSIGFENRLFYTIASLIILLVAPLFYFVTIFYSLEKSSMLQSIMRSVQTSLKYFPFILPALAIDLFLQWGLQVFLFFYLLRLDVGVNRFVLPILFTYVHLGVDAAYLLFYRDKIKK